VPRSRQDDADALDLAREAILVLTRDGMVRDANGPALVALHPDLLDADLNDTGLLQIADPPVADLIAESQDGGSAVHGVLTFLRPDGQKQPWVCSATSLGSGGVVLRHLNKDLAAKKDVVDLEDKVEDLVEEVERRALSEAQALELSAAKSRFLAAASHDLRQPLHAMSLFTRALSRRVDSEEERELVTQMDKALVSLRRMFDTLLNVSKLDAGLIEPVLQDIALDDLLAPVCDALTTQCEDAGLSGRVRIPPVQVRTDRALLETMVRNLISNAVKFTGSGGVLLGVRRRAGHAVIEVIDTGPGMDEAQQHSVFDEFERARKGARAQNEGLGLSIVQRLAHLLDIEIELHSRPGHGSRFILWVPLAESERTACGVAPEAARDSRNGGSPISGRTIIVLDDDPMVVLAMKHELVDQGATVIPAHSAEELSGHVGEGSRIDAAVVDYDLGDELGPDAIDAFRKQYDLDFPILVVTGSTNPETLQTLQQKNYTWLNKPLDPDLLVAVLGGMLPSR